MKALPESKPMMMIEDGTKRRRQLKKCDTGLESSKIKKILLQGVDKNIVGKLAVKQVGSTLVIDVVELLYMIQDVKMEVTR